jgi:hypothetical protein
VFWDPAICPGVLPAVALPLRAARDGPVFRLGDLPGHITLLRHRLGSQHVLIETERCTIQLAVSGASVLKPVRLLVDLLPERTRVRSHLDAMERLNRLWSVGRLSSRLPCDDTSNVRLRLVLQALDGWCAGASQREIAAALFGAARVRRAWGDPRGHLRDVVRRAIRRGRALMERDYRALLG